MYWNVLMCFTIIIIIGNKVQFLNPHVVSVARAALYSSVLCLSSRVKERKKNTAGIWVDKNIIAM